MAALYSPSPIFSFGRGSVSSLCPQRHAAASMACRSADGSGITTHADAIKIVTDGGSEGGKGKGRIFRKIKNITRDGFYDETIRIHALLCPGVHHDHPLSQDIRVMSTRGSESAAMDSSSERAPLLQTSAAQRRQSYPRIPERLLLPKTVVRALLALLVLLTAALLTAIIVQEYKDRQDPRWGKGRNYRPVLAHGKHGAVAAESERCSQIGVDGECQYREMERV